MMKNKEQQIKVLVDSREQLPFDFSKFDMESESVTLPFGDYTLGYPDLRKSVIIERKSLPDFVMCCGRERSRFEKEILALRGFQYRYVVCEFSVGDVLNKRYRSQVHPNAVLGSLARWTVEGIQFLHCEHREGAEYITAKILQFHARLAIDIASCQCLIR